MKLFVHLRNGTTEASGRVGREMPEIPGPDRCRTGPDQRQLLRPTAGVDTDRPARPGLGSSA